ncbi:hypothetical protein F2Q69_00048251 [Brassica cretica]|uniref:Uncharacterized protein n=1 Tax=Brassica cretica TaxID=69181 RepID=A0A8S9PPC9_BRACR|nr:hypothetical protein F2Q69_00048251 [Brassica cretica]
MGIGIRPWDARFWCLWTRGRERPWYVAPTSLSGLRERAQWVALRGRSGLHFVSSRHGNASDIGASLWQVALRGRLHGVASVRSLWCAARPLIALNTSFEFQMYPNASKNSMSISYTSPSSGNFTYSTTSWINSEFRSLLSPTLVQHKGCNMFSHTSLIQGSLYVRVQPRMILMSLTTQQQGIVIYHVPFPFGTCNHLQQSSSDSNPAVID